MKESLAKNWINGLNITTEATFIQPMDTAHRFRRKKSITGIEIGVC